VNIAVNRITSSADLGTVCQAVKIDNSVKESVFSPNLTLMEHHTMMGILRSDKYGPDGDPLYIINNQPIQRMKVAANLIQKHKIPPQDTSRKGIYG